MGKMKEIWIEMQEKKLEKARTWEKYTMTYEMIDFVRWYIELYGSYDRELYRIMEKPYFYNEVFEQYELDTEWH
tara:strand:- start:213 stop:434 length:222 start_codon:yes stop_codon:yes gene_type:complete